MQRTLKVILALLLSPFALHAQAIVAAGVQGGSSFGNYFLGASSLALVPITRHFEIDAQDTFSPVEIHTALGSGWSNTATAGGILWVRHGVGIDGGGSLSNYSVAHASKIQEFGHGGLTLRTASLSLLSTRIPQPSLRT